VSAFALGYGGAAEGLLKMALGNRLGVALADDIDALDLFAWQYGSFLVETDEPVGVTLGRTTQAYAIAWRDERVDLDELEAVWSEALEPVFPANATAQDLGPADSLAFEAPARARPRAQVARPRALIPVFPGTTGEWETAAALRAAGAEPEILILRNLSARDVAESAAKLTERLNASQILFLAGGFTGGDEPDGAGKLVAAFLQNPRIAEAIQALLQTRDGLIGGISNGFAALVRLGLLPFGEIRAPGPDVPTLTYGPSGRHQSRLVHTRVASTLSPWLMHAKVGDVHTAPVFHGEGRFACAPALLDTLAARGQIATQYADPDGRASMDILYNPCGSTLAIEGVTSPDGRVFGRIAHSERTGNYLYKNVPGNKETPMFRGAADYFR